MSENQTGDLQDPADPNRVETAVETEPQPAQPVQEGPKTVEESPETVTPTPDQDDDSDDNR